MQNPSQCYSSYYCTSMWHCSHFKCIINTLPPRARASSAKSAIHSLDFIFDFLVLLPLRSRVAICHFERPQCLSLLPVPPLPAPLFFLSPKVLALGQGIELGVSDPSSPGHHSG